MVDHAVAVMGLVLDVAVGKGRKRLGQVGRDRLGVEVVVDRERRGPRPQSGCTLVVLTGELRHWPGRVVGSGGQGQEAAIKADLRIGGDRSRRQAGLAIHAGSTGTPLGEGNRPVRGLHGTPDHPGGRLPFLLVGRRAADQMGRGHCATGLPGLRGHQPHRVLAQEGAAPVDDLDPESTRRVRWPYPSRPDGAGTTGCGRGRRGGRVGRVHPLHRSCGTGNRRCRGCRFRGRGVLGEVADRPDSRCAMGDLDQAAPRGNRAWRPVAIGIDQPLPVGIGVIAKPDPPDRLGHGAPDAAHIAGTGQCRTEVAVEVVRPAQECRPGAVQRVR